MRETLSKRNKQRADDFAKNMQPVIEGLKQKGVVSIRAMTAELNGSKVPTYTGKGKWHTRSVHTLVKRMETIQERSGQVH
jgi:hypothetical protein